MIKKIIVLGACLAMAGCMPHFKELDSYNTNFRNNEVTPPDKGDPYTFGGIAEGSGGIMARQSYATDNGGPDFRDATSTGKLGEIAHERSETPGNLPGEATLPEVPAAASTPQTPAGATSISGLVSPAVQSPTSGTATTTAGH